MHATCLANCILPYFIARIKLGKYYKSWSLHDAFISSIPSHSSISLCGLFSNTFNVQASCNIRGITISVVCVIYTQIEGTACRNVVYNTHALSEPSTALATLSQQLTEPKSGGWHIKAQSRCIFVHLRPFSPTITMNSEFSCIQTHTTFTRLAPSQKLYQHQQRSLSWKTNSCLGSKKSSAPPPSSWNLNSITVFTRAY